jgi:hypothetical protein
MFDRAIILKRVETAEDAVVPRLRTWLQRDDTHFVSHREAKVTVSEALRLWTARLKNTDITGMHLDGATSFVTRLKSYAPQRKIAQVALAGPDTTGTLFFDGSTHDFVGAVVVDTTTPRKRLP